MGKGRNGSEGDKRQDSATDQTADTGARGETTGATYDGSTGIDTWHGTRIKSRTCLLSVAGEYMENGTSAKSGTCDKAVELGFSNFRRDVGRGAAKKSGERKQFPWQC